MQRTMIEFNRNSNLVTFPELSREWECLTAEFECASPQAILRWAMTRFGERLTLGTGLGASGIVLMHMLREVIRKPNIFFLDTGLHFEETYQLINRLERALDIKIELIRPAESVMEQKTNNGPELWQRNPDMCCHLRKVLPLRRQLANYDGWLTGLRRDQGATRANTPIVRYVGAYDVVKVNPLATWTQEMIWLYIHAHDLPYNTLHDEGYPSIGCFPCTQPVAIGTAERAGRWMGMNKTECGLHTV